MMLIKHQVRRALGADEREGCADSATSVAYMLQAVGTMSPHHLQHVLAPLAQMLARELPFGLPWPDFHHAHLIWLACSGCSSSCSAEHGPEGPGSDAAN
eukprot:2789522-Amphidinium_carterae.1